MSAKVPLTFAQKYRYRWRKSLLLIGGGGTELGEAIAKTFANSRFKKWEVLQIDSECVNPKATKNIIIKQDEILDAQRMDQLHSELKDFTEELCAVINITEAKHTQPQLDFKSESVFEEYEKIQVSEMRATMLAAHIAANYLSANGYLCFSATVDTLKHLERDSNGQPIGNNMIHRALKMAQMQTGLNLAGSRGFKELFYANACTNVLIWDKLNTKENRMKNPNLNYTQWPNPE